MISFGEVPASSVLPIFFDSYAGATGASITLTGLAITDVEIYKGTSMTQRSSDAGVVLIDTDGIDLDGVTGIHGFSIDLGDNTDAGFYAAGSFYNVVVSAVTIDSQTVNFVAATFRIKAAEAIAGKAKVDVDALLGTAWLAPGTAGTPDVNAKLIGGTAQTGRDLGTSVLLSSGTGTGQLKLASGYVAMTWADIAAPTTTVNLSGTTVKTATDIATLIGATGSGLTSLATAAALATVDGIVDDILVDTGTTLQAELDGIQATLGVAGAGLTALGDARIGTIPADVYDWFWGKGGGVAAVEAAVWDAVIASHLTAGSTGSALNAVGDPWATALPGAYAGGSAGKIIGDNINATISSRAAATNLATANTNISAIITTLGVAGAGLTAVVWNAAWDAEVQSEVADALIATSLTESYRAVGAAGTLPQMLYESLALLGEKAVSGVTLTTKKVDQATTAAVYTLDSATAPTSITRAS